MYQDHLLATEIAQSTSLTGGNIRQHEIGVRFANFEAIVVCHAVLCQRRQSDASQSEPTPTNSSYGIHVDLTVPYGGRC